MTGKISATVAAEIRRLRPVMGLKKVAAACGVSPTTVRRYTDDVFRERATTATRTWRERNSGRPSEQAVLERLRREQPLFDPVRDGVPPIVSNTAYLCGDPPPGRREMLASHMGSYWLRQNLRPLKPIRRTHRV